MDHIHCSSDTVKQPHSKQLSHPEAFGRVRARPRFKGVINFITSSPSHAHISSAPSTLSESFLQLMNSIIAKSTALLPFLALISSNSRTLATQSTFLDSEPCMFQSQFPFRQRQHNQLIFGNVNWVTFHFMKLFYMHGFRSSHRASMFFSQKHGLFCVTHGSVGSQMSFVAARYFTRGLVSTIWFSTDDKYFCSSIS